MKHWNKIVKCIIYIYILYKYWIWICCKDSYKTKFSMNIETWYEWSTSLQSFKKNMLMSLRTIEVEIFLPPKYLRFRELGSNKTPNKNMLDAQSSVSSQDPGKSLNWKLQVQNILPKFLCHLTSFIGKSVSFISLLATVSLFLRMIYWNKYEDLNCFKKLVKQTSLLLRVQPLEVGGNYHRENNSK